MSHVRGNAVGLGKPSEHGKYKRAINIIFQFQRSLLVTSLLVMSLVDPRTHSTYTAKAEQNLEGRASETLFLQNRAGNEEGGGAGGRGGGREKGRREEGRRKEGGKKGRKRGREEGKGERKENLKYDNQVVSSSNLVYQHFNSWNSLEL